MSLDKSITFVFEADITEKLYFLWYTEMAISWEVGKFPNIWILKEKEWGKDIRHKLKMGIGNFFMAALHIFNC